MNPMFIQTLRWMMQEKVWRIIGFASAIVGLLCYALSSSFNHLFGHWNLFKIILYTVFSFIICFLILYAKTCDQSSSVRFEAQFAFLILTITSVYSFFSDKVMNGKPDAYSLFSCVAFAIMSLSLSRRTQCKFQVDLLYFFLGCLIVQLMKIKLQLGIVGVSFSYSLIILRSCFPSIDVRLENGCHPGRFQDENLVVLVDVVDSPDITVSSMMEQLRTYVKALQHDDSKLIENFEDESESLFSDRSFEGTFMIDSMPLPLVMIQKLQDTAKLLMSVGFEKECSEVYVSCRRECLQLQKVCTIEKFHNTWDWEGLNNQIKKWIKASKVSLKILFPIERRLSDLVFLGFSTAADLAFTEVCKGCTLQLLNFADSVATGSRSPERLFRTLEMFETLRDLIPEFESLFCDQYSVSLRNEAVTILKRLGEAIRGIFMEFENSIRQDPANAKVLCGRLHPVVLYVMNYLRAACDHWQTLEQLFEDFVHPLKEFEDRVQSSSSVSLQMNWIIEVLENNLVAKSEIYRDPAFRYVFLMYNSVYIAQKIKDTELGVLLGNDVIQKQKEKVQQHHEHYLKCSWDKVLEILKLDIIKSMPLPPNDVAKSMKQKLKSFNMVFEKICRVQSSWFIFDEQLKEEIRISIEKILLPAYGNFIGRFRSVPELGKHADRYIKYGTDDIEARLKDLFQGRRVGSTGSRRRS